MPKLKFFQKFGIKILFRGSAPPAGGGSAGPNMYSVYAIFNAKHGKIYIGQSKDLDIRLKLHQEGLFKNSYTARFDGKWILIYRKNFETRKETLIREKQLKSYQGRKFIKQFIPR